MPTVSGVQVQEEGEVHLLRPPHHPEGEGSGRLSAEWDCRSRPQRPHPRHLLPSLPSVRRHVRPHQPGHVQDCQLHRVTDGQHVHHGVSHQSRRGKGRGALLHAQRQSLPIQVRGDYMEQFANNNTFFIVY